MYSFRRSIKYVEAVQLLIIGLIFLRDRICPPFSPAALYFEINSPGQQIKNAVPPPPPPSLIQLMRVHHRQTQDAVVRSQTCAPVCSELSLTGKRRKLQLSVCRPGQVTFVTVSLLQQPTFPPSSYTENKMTIDSLE